MKIKVLVSLMLLGLILMTKAQAALPTWTFSPLTATSMLVPSNSSGTIMYVVTNQSNKAHTLAMQPITGMVQVTLGSGVCKNPFTLLHKGDKCILSLQALGYDLTHAIEGGPVVCQQSTTPQCYRPGEDNEINVAQTQPVTLPANCMDTADNNIQCSFPPNTNPATSYGFTNMTYALCRSAQCPYNPGDVMVNCGCDLIKENQGVYSASVSPVDYDSSKPNLNTVHSTYSLVDSAGEAPTLCSASAFANCFGALCTVSGNSVSCSCQVDTIDSYYAPKLPCNLTNNKIWSATSASSFNSIQTSMLFMYNTFFDGATPN